MSSEKLEGLHPTTAESRCRVPKSNIRWSYASKGREEFEMIEGSKNPQEQGPQNHQAASLEGSQRSGILYRSNILFLLKVRKEDRYTGVKERLHSL